MPRTHLISDRRYLHDCEACSNIPSFPFVSPCLPENSVRKSPSYLYQTEELPDHTTYTRYSPSQILYHPLLLRQSMRYESADRPYRATYVPNIPCHVS